MKKTIPFYVKIIFLSAIIIVFGCKKDEGNLQTCGKGSGIPVAFCKQVDHYESGYGVPGQDEIHVDCIVGPDGATVSNQTNGAYYCSGTYKLTTYDNAKINIGWGGTTYFSHMEECTIYKGEGTFSVSITKTSGGEGNMALDMSSGSSYMFSTVLVNICK
jgi:hypothetical protein